MTKMASATYESGDVPQGYFGPGFLSFVFFSGNANVLHRGPHRLYVANLLPHDETDNGEAERASRWRAVGTRTDVGRKKSGLFENIIGIY